MFHDRVEKSKITDFLRKEYEILLFRLTFNIPSFFFFPLFCHEPEGKLIVHFVKLTE